MSNYKSSINQQKKSLTIQERHNDRSISPNYLICKRNIEVNHNASNALKKRNEIISNAIANYQKNCNSKNKKFQAKSYEWSAVCNIKPDTTMEQLEKIADYYEQNLGFQCYQIAIHRDEGHLVSLKNENITLNAGKDFFLDQKTGIYYKGAVVEKQSKKGIKSLKYVKTNEILAQNIDELKKEYEILINHHAHLEFISLDKSTGKNRSRDLFNDKQKMRELQSKVAEILEMERGADKRISGAERIKPRAYGAMKQREKAERKALNDELQSKNAKNSDFNKAFNELDKELGLPYQENIVNSAKSYIAEIKKIKNRNAELEQKNQVNADIKGLNAQEQQLKQNIDELKKEYKANRESFKQSEKATQQDYMNLRKDFETKKAEIEAELEKLKKQYDADFERRKKATARANARLKKIFEEKKRKLIDDYNQEKAVIEHNKKMAMLDEAIAKTNQKDNQTEFLMPNMPKIDFDDDTQPNYHKKR